MNEVLKVLYENSYGFLATVEDGKPRVRPFGFMLEEEGKLYFCTNSQKNVFKQLNTTPYVEYSVTSKDMITVRIRGEIRFTDSIETKEKIINASDIVKRGYKTADNPLLKVFYLEHGSAILVKFGNPPTNFEF